MPYPILVMCILFTAVNQVSPGWSRAADVMAMDQTINEPGSTSATSSAAPSPLFDLPADGPRLEESTEVQDGSLFKEGLDAYRRGDMAEAARLLRRYLKELPDDVSVPAARAHLAEAIYRLRETPQYRLQAIDAYQTLVREFPRSANASMARWRIGDLYLEQGWIQEARNSFEWAVAESETERDASIASLGLGLTMLAAGQWTEAGQTFAGLRAHVEQDDLVQRAMLGVADALLGEKRFADSRSAYDAVMRQWPGFLRSRPLGLFHFAETEEALQHGQAARALYTTFYNLFPQHEDAAAALIKIGDGYRRGGRGDRGALFYKVALRDYGQTPHAATARLRLAELGQDTAQGATDRSLRLEIAALFHDPLDPPLAFDQQARIFRTFLAQHRHDALGSEALFHLAEHVAFTEQPERAIPFYRELSERAGLVPNDPWPPAAAQRLTAILRPQLVAALHDRDDLRAAELFHRHGRHAAQSYVGTGLIVQVAETHRRLGFLAEAVKQYQEMMQSQKNLPFRQEILVGLGRTYLAQGDPVAARTVLDRYRLEYPLGTLKSEVLQLVAQAWHQAGNDERVVRTCRQWFKRYPIESKRLPEHEPMLLLLARAEEAVGVTNDALQTYAKAERAGLLKNLQARLRYADLLVEANRSDAALPQYQEVIRQAPDSDEAAWARVHAANIWAERKQYAEARAALLRPEQSAGDGMWQRYAVALRGELELRAAPEKGENVRQSGR